MKTIVKQKMTYADFLNYKDDTDYLYELEDGELIQMPSESEMNLQIGMFLLSYLFRLGFASVDLRKEVEIAVRSTEVNVRIPDLIIRSKELSERMKGANRSLVTLDMPPPSLVVEVFSPNQSKRDYEDKRWEYGNRGIPEYWIIDPILQKVTVLELKDNAYAENVFIGEQPIVSLLLGKLELTAKELLKGGEA